MQYFFVEVKESEPLSFAQRKRKLGKTYYELTPPENDDVTMARNIIIRLRMTAPTTEQ